MSISSIGLAAEADGSLIKMEDGKPYLALNYANGPGFNYHRMDENGTATVRKDLTQDNDDDLICKYSRSK